MTIKECEKDFKEFIDELWMPRDDYKGIMEYIDEGVALLEEQHAVEPKEAKCETFGSTRKCSECIRYLFPAGRYCPHCGRPVRWDDD